VARSWGGPAASKKCDICLSLFKAILSPPDVDRDIGRASSGWDESGVVEDNHIVSSKEGGQKRAQPLFLRLVEERLGVGVC
jgi:hypothetical protein